MLNLPFDIAEARKSSILVSGANASGKTLLSASIASNFYKLGYTVIVIDVSGVWKNLSDLPYYVKVIKVNGQIRIPKFEQDTSRIYDLSNLKLSETKQVLEALSELIWSERINQDNPTQTYLFLEESETFLKSIRGKESENVYRLVHVGRNINVRCVLISTDLALIDASIIRLCGIRFHGFLNVEENSKRKFRNYYGLDWARMAYEALDAGTFIRFRQYNRAKPLDVLSVPLFEAKTKPRMYVPAPTVQPIKAKPESNQDVGVLEALGAILTTPFALIGGNTTSKRMSNIRQNWNELDQEDQEEDEFEELDGALIL